MQFQNEHNAFSQQTVILFKTSDKQSNSEIQSGVLEYKIDFFLKVTVAL